MKKVRVGDVGVLNNPAVWGIDGARQLHGELCVVTAVNVYGEYVNVFHDGPSDGPFKGNYIQYSNKLIVIDHFTKKEMDALKLDEL